MTARIPMQNRWLLFCSLLMATVLVASCGKDPVNNDTTPTTGSITVNLTATDWIDPDGHPVRASLIGTLSDTVAVKSEVSVIDGSTAQITLADIPSGDYQLLVAIRHDSSAFDGEINMSDSDYFWVGLDIAVAGADTIELSQTHWQLFSSKAILAVVRGIPDAYEGELVGGGIFENGFDALASSQPWHTALASSYAYNGSVVLSLYLRSEFGFDEIQAGDYDLWCVVDMDGTPANWANGSNTAGCENGDMIAQIDINYLGANHDQIYENEVDFMLLDAQTLTLNVTIPSGSGLVGHSAYAYVYASFDDSYVALGQAVIEGNQATVSVDVLQSGTYQLLLIADKDDSFQPFWPDLLCLSLDDYLWGTLDLNVTSDLTINISDSAWQNYQGFIYSVKGIPAGNDGKPFAVALYQDGDEPLSVNDDPVFNGVAMVYNNSAMVALHSTGIFGDSSSVPVGDYDAWTLVDVDGHMSNYVGDSIYRPATAGDQYFKIDIEYTEDNRYGDYREIAGTFLPFVEVYGDINCSSFSGNNIYVYLFRENPFAGDGADPVVMYVASEPGPYSIPYFSNDSMYIVAFWDNDGSGEEGGPTPGDMVGAYGVADGGDFSTEATHVMTNTLATGNRDFDLWMVYSAPTRISKH